MFWMQGSFILLVQLYLLGASTADPCTNYSRITDKRLTVAFTAHHISSSLCQETLSVTVWYRYSATSSGRMTNKCPKDLQCGSENQMWFNDTIPTVADGEVKKHICTHEGLDCCAQSNQIPTKNCTDFIVYQLIPGRYCFNYCYEAPGSQGGNSGSENNTASILLWLMIAFVVVLRCVDFNI